MKEPICIKGEELRQGLVNVERGPLNFKDYDVAQAIKERDKLSIMAFMALNKHLAECEICKARKKEGGI